MDNTFIFNQELNHVREHGLSWFPWVGADYKSQPHKVLLIGESHYVKESPLGESHHLCDLDEIALYENFTIDVVQESRIDRRWSTPFLSNLHWALVRTNSFPGKRLWRNVAFYNFIQRPMNTQYERPTWEDFSFAWRPFVELVKVLKPTVCIFLGNSAANFFNDAMATLAVEHEKVSYVKYLNGAWGKKAALKNESIYLPIHFIRHTGKYFSWSSWNEYLRQNLPEVMAYLECIVATPPEQKTEDESFTSRLYIRERTSDIPMGLAHKPIIACNYEDACPDDDDDARFISVGRAQYNNNQASVKIFRHSGKHWSRQSEEVPIFRLGYMMQMLLTAILHLQENDDKTFQTNLNEEIIDPEALNFLREEVRSNRAYLKESFGEIRALLEILKLERI